MDAATIVQRGVDLRAVWEEVIVPRLRQEVQMRALRRLNLDYPESLSCGECNSREAAINALIDAAVERNNQVFKPRRS